MSNLISFIIKPMQVDAKYSTCKATRKSRYSNHFKPFNHNGSKELWCKFWKLKETNNLVLTILTTESVNCVFQAEIENFWGRNMRYMATWRTRVLTFAKSSNDRLSVRSKVLKSTGVYFTWRNTRYALLTMIKWFFLRVHLFVWANVR